MSKRYSQEEVKKLVNSLNPNIEVVGKYVNNRTPLLFRCKLDGHEWNTTLDKINKGQGCAACNGKVAIKGKTDLWTTRPDVACLLKNIEDGYSIMEGSRKAITFICPICGEEKNTAVRNISENGFHCDYCDDGYSFPEKFIMCLLKQLDIKYTTQYSKKIVSWCNKFRYDFKIDDTSCIIETHGIQHYEKCGFTGRTLMEEQTNDKLKKQLAKQNGIKHYIVLDCRKSELEWIKRSVMESELPIFFNFTEKDIDWNECCKFAYNSFIKIICDMWNEGIYKSSDISEKINITSWTVVKYLNIGNKLGLCSYNGRDEKIKGSIKKVICLTTGEIFNSIIDASNMYNTSGIGNCCKGLTNSSGKLEDGTKLRWMYYDEYIKFNNIKQSNLNNEVAFSI